MVTATTVMAGIVTMHDFFETLGCIDFGHASPLPSLLPRGRTSQYFNHPVHPSTLHARDTGPDFDPNRNTLVASQLSKAIPLSKTIPAQSLAYRKPITPASSKNHMEGYAKLATLMGAYPEVAIVRRFAALNMQRILYLQAEIVELESRLREIEQEDKLSGDVNRVDCAFDWLALQSYTEPDHSVPEASPKLNEKPAGSPSRPASSEASLRPESRPPPADGPHLPRNRRWALMAALNEKLREYNEAVLSQCSMVKLDKPSNRDLETLKALTHSSSGNNISLSGLDALIWERPDKLDLLVIQSQRPDSFLSSIVKDKLIYWLHQHIVYPIRRKLDRLHPPPPPIPDDNADPTRLDAITTATNTTYYSNTTLQGVVRIVATAFASLLPVLAITVLYCIETTRNRLIGVAGFTLLFSLALGLFTRGELVDVFAASAAFAAVQVVFVGSVIGSEQGGLGGKPDGGNGTAGA